jgi:hypothetical protein
MRSRAAIDNLKTLVNKAICVNNNLYKLSLEEQAEQHLQDNKILQQPYIPNTGQR